jgi:PHD/YefM family antitoxin component YafN of YafNO toxin-antitoxin module
LERKRLEEVVAVCYSYRDYREEEEEARKRRQEKLSRRREEEEARRARKQSTDRDRVLVKS